MTTLSTAQIDYLNQIAEAHLHNVEEMIREARDLLLDTDLKMGSKEEQAARRMTWCLQGITDYRRNKRIAA